MFAEKTAKWDAFKKGFDEKKVAADRARKKRRVEAGEGKKEVEVEGKNGERESLRGSSSSSKRPESDQATQGDGGDVNATTVFKLNMEKHGVCTGSIYGHHDQQMSSDHKTSKFAAPMNSDEPAGNVVPAQRRHSSSSTPGPKNTLRTYQDLDIALAESATANSATHEQIHRDLPPKALLQASQTQASIPSFMEKIADESLSQGTQLSQDSYGSSGTAGRRTGLKLKKDRTRTRYTARVVRSAVPGSGVAEMDLTQEPEGISSQAATAAPTHTAIGLKHSEKPLAPPSTENHFDGPPSTCNDSETQIPSQFTAANHPTTIQPSLQPSSSAWSLTQIDDVDAKMCASVLPTMATMETTRTMGASMDVDVEVVVEMEEDAEKVGRDEEGRQAESFVYNSVRTPYPRIDEVQIVEESNNATSAKDPPATRERGGGDGIDPIHDATMTTMTEVDKPEEAEFGTVESEFPIFERGLGYRDPADVGPSAFASLSLSMFEFSNVGKAAGSGSTGDVGGKPIVGTSKVHNAVGNGTLQMERGANALTEGGGSGQNTDMDLGNSEGLRGDGGMNMDVDESSSDVVEIDVDEEADASAQIRIEDKKTLKESKRHSELKSSSQDKSKSRSRSSSSKSSSAKSESAVAKGSLPLQEYFGGSSEDRGRRREQKEGKAPQVASGGSKSAVHTPGTPGPAESPCGGTVGESLSGVNGSAKKADTSSAKKRRSASTSSSRSGSRNNAGEAVEGDGRRKAGSKDGWKESLKSAGGGSGSGTGVRERKKKVRIAEVGEDLDEVVVLTPPPAGQPAQQVGLLATNSAIGQVDSMPTSTSTSSRHKKSHSSSAVKQERRMNKLEAKEQEDVDSKMQQDSKKPIPHFTATISTSSLAELPTVDEALFGQQKESRSESGSAVGGDAANAAKMDRNKESKFPPAGAAALSTSAGGFATPTAKGKVKVKRDSESGFSSSHGSHASSRSSRETTGSAKRTARKSNSATVQSREHSSSRRGERDGVVASESADNRKEAPSNKRRISNELDGRSRSRSSSRSGNSRDPTPVRGGGHQKDIIENVGRNAAGQTRHSTPTPVLAPPATGDVSATATPASAAPKSVTVDGANQVRKVAKPAVRLLLTDTPLSPAFSSLMLNGSVEPSLIGVGANLDVGDDTRSPIKSPAQTHIARRRDTAVAAGIEQEQKARGQSSKKNSRSSGMSTPTTSKSSHPTHSAVGNNNSKAKGNIGGSGSTEISNKESEQRHQSKEAGIDKKGNEDEPQGADRTFVAARSKNRRESTTVVTESPFVRAQLHQHVLKQKNGFATDGSGRGRERSEDHGDDEEGVVVVVDDDDIDDVTMNEGEGGDTGGGQSRVDEETVQKYKQMMIGTTDATKPSSSTSTSAKKPALTASSNNNTSAPLSKGLSIASNGSTASVATTATSASVFSVSNGQEYGSSRNRNLGMNSAGSSALVRCSSTAPRIERHGSGFSRSSSGFSRNGSDQFGRKPSSGDPLARLRSGGQDGYEGDDAPGSKKIVRSTSVNVVDVLNGRTGVNGKKSSGWINCATANSLWFEDGNGKRGGVKGGSSSKVGGGLRREEAEDQFMFDDDGRVDANSFRRREGEPSYVYKEVVRKKDERKKLHAETCECCAGMSVHSAKFPS
ncbi:hypothetical protein HK102_000271 [Quaeritorhiza haematococci]|nr:hypothetical protein HK102_000271 [Quaeritorhiza haematococci]